MIMRHLRRAYGIITRDDKILVFREQKTDGVIDIAQFPGGTIDDDESIEDGLLREVYEETGLTDIRIVRQLGCATHSPAPHVISLRHFYLLECKEEMPETWIHYELHSSEHDHPLPYRYEWMTKHEAALHLGGGHDQFLHLI